jgi:hypothetical protein
VLGKNWDQHSSSLPTSCFLCFINVHRSFWLSQRCLADWKTTILSIDFQGLQRLSGSCWILWPFSRLAGRTFWATHDFCLEPPVDVQLGPSFLPEKRSPIETISENAQRLHPIWGSTIFGQTQF